MISTLENSPTTPNADAIIAFDYGDGGFVDGRLAPGAANQALADWIDQNALDHQTKVPTVPVFAQVLIGQALLEKYPHLKDSELFRIVPEKHESGANSKPDDNTDPFADDYVSTWDVANAAREEMPAYRACSLERTPEQRELRRNGKPLGRVAVVAAAQHASRTKWQTNKAFAGTAEVFVPEGLQKVYPGAESTQRWTRNAANWKAGNALAWLFSRINNGPADPNTIKAVPKLAGSWLKQKLASVRALILNK